MIELSKTASSPQSATPSVVSPVVKPAVSDTNSQNFGNVLPHSQEAANIRRSSSDKSADFQQEVKAAVSHMNEYIQASQRDLSFRYDAERGETVVQVLDRNTQEVIRQIPDAIFLKIAQQLADEAPGALLSARV